MRGFVNGKRMWKESLFATYASCNRGVGLGVKILFRAKGSGLSVEKHNKKDDVEQVCQAIC